MRVLVANKFWYRRGGLERVMFDEIAWLEAAGHEVAHFSTAHPSNDSSPWQEHFAPYLELGAEGGLPAGRKVRAALRMFSNGEAAKRFDALCGVFKPDVVHMHGIHRQISPSVLGVARRRGVPVVQTLHDYHHICPADVLLYAGGEVCEPRRCGVYGYGACVRGRCVRGSVSASALSAAETSFQRVRHAYERGVARFISPSRFLASRMGEGGWRVPIDVVPNAVPVLGQRDGLGAGVCVIGRLTREKGVEVALKAARAAGASITVAGEGPLGEHLRERFPGATFVGRLDGPSVAALVARSSAVLVPSLWYENAPMSVLEAMSAGTPVIASSVGGIPEQVTDEADGLLAAPGDVDAFAAAIGRVISDDSLARRLGGAARDTVAKRFSPERHLEGLLASYRAAGAAS